jgi:hypothetical protein
LRKKEEGKVGRRISHNFKEVVQMNKNPEQAPPPTPERHESLCIASVVIPADDDQPLDQRQVRPFGLADYHELVDGDIEGVHLEQPPARMYVNEVGKVRGLPMNRRATLLLWMHNKAFRYSDEILVGNTFLIGPGDDDGNDTAAPDEYIRTLFAAERFYFEVRLTGDGRWQRHARTFDNWTEAYGFALGWAIGPDDKQKSWIDDIRVVPEV